MSSHIRIGETVIAPSISPGEVDYLLAFEAAEGLRLAPSVTPGGVAIVNTQQIVPPLASQGGYEYPFDAIARMDGGGRRVVVVDGNAVALEVGDAQGRRRRARRRALHAPALRSSRRGRRPSAATCRRAGWR